MCFSKACSLSFFIADTKYPTLKVKAGKAYWAQFLQVSVHYQVAPWQGGMSDRHCRGETVHGGQKVGKNPKQNKGTTTALSIPYIVSKQEGR